MRRHPALIPFSHDHHHGLVQARRLRRAAGREPADRRGAAAAFLEFYARETHAHFREEEERLFPLLAGADEPATALVTRALLDHQQLHARTASLEAELTEGEAPPAQMRELADALEQHIRFEERTLFPLIEEVAAEERLQRLQATEAARAAVDPPAAEATGPLWGAATEDLNATLVAWPPGGGPHEHVNDERDVLVVALSGSATVTIDGDAHVIETGQAVAIEKGRTRRITAGPEGVRYLSVHTRRPPLQIASPRTQKAG